MNCFKWQRKRYFLTLFLLDGVYFNTIEDRHPALQLAVAREDFKRTVIVEIWELDRKTFLKYKEIMNARQKGL